MNKLTTPIASNITYQPQHHYLHQHHVRDTKRHSSTRGKCCPAATVALRKQSTWYLVAHTAVFRVTVCLLRAMSRSVHRSMRPSAHAYFFCDIHTFSMMRVVALISVLCSTWWSTTCTCTQARRYKRQKGTYRHKLGLRIRRTPFWGPSWVLNTIEYQGMLTTINTR